MEVEFKTGDVGTGKMAQRLRMFTPFVEDLGSVSITHKAAHNCLPLPFQSV